MKTVWEIIKFIGLLLWQLPQSIIGWLMILWFVIIGKVKFIRYYNYTFIFSADAMTGSISLGTIIILCTRHAEQQATIQHECGHVVQSHYLGWLYLFVIGIPSILWATFYRRLGYTNYYVFYTESWANKLGYVEPYVYNGYVQFMKILKPLF